jgi:hypothetical protein
MMLPRPHGRTAPRGAALIWRRSTCIELGTARREEAMPAVFGSIIRGQVEPWVGRRHCARRVVRDQRLDVGPGRAGGTTPTLP